MTSSSYSLTQARREMDRLAAPHADVTAIAQWAREHTDEPHSGILVDQQGTIWAETITQGGPDHRATYVTAVRGGIDAEGIQDTEAGLAGAEITRQTGCPVVLIPEWRLAQGHVAQGDRQLTGPQVAARIGVKTATWRSYVARGQAPAPDGRYDRRTPFWRQSTIDRWRSPRA